MKFALNVSQSVLHAITLKAAVLHGAAASETVQMDLPWIGVEKETRTWLANSQDFHGIIFFHWWCFMGGVFGFPSICNLLHEQNKLCVIALNIVKVNQR